MKQAGFDHDSRPRRLPFEGAINFRDLGGYRVAPGRHIAWGRIYRSDSLADLSATDLEAFAALGLRSICDFRLESERRRKPNRLPQDAQTAVYSIGFAPAGTTEMWGELNRGSLPAAQVEQRMRQHYVRLVLDHTAEYRQMLEVLLKPEALPALIHCASGKDRTGLGAAIILMALGASRETILEDYVLSDQYRRELTHLLEAHVDPLALASVMQAHPSYLASAFATIDDHWGSDQAFLSQALRLSEAERALLRALLLEAD